MICLDIWIYVFSKMQCSRRDVCQGLNSHYFHIIGDGHQPTSRGLYYPLKGFPIKGGMTIPNIATFDHGTCVFVAEHSRL